MKELMDIEPTKLITHVIIIALSTLGIVEWLKNFIKCKYRKTYAIIGLITLSICASMQLFAKPVYTTWFNLFTLGIAILQFGHTALIKVPEKLINKAIGEK